MKIEKKEFHVNIMLSKTKVFEVSYYSLGSNESPYFTTSASIFQRGKRDFDRCGQCQNYALKGYPLAMNFYEKWDYMHLKKMDDKTYCEMVSDLEELLEEYPSIIHQEYYKPKDISFEELREFSMIKR